DQSLRQTVMTNTAIKIVGGLSEEDARAFAKEMRCEPEFLLDMQKNHRRTQFAYYIRNHTQRAFGVGIPFGEMERQPRLTVDDLVGILAQNRARYCDASPPELPPPTANAQSPTGF